MATLRANFRRFAGRSDLAIGAGVLSLVSFLTARWRRTGAQDAELSLAARSGLAAPQARCAPRAVVEMMGKGGGKKKKKSQVSFAQVLRNKATHSSCRFNCVTFWHWEFYIGTICKDFLVWLRMLNPDLGAVLR